MERRVLLKTFNFIGDTTYTTREGISYRIDNKEHNIQRVGKSWVVDGKASSLEEMVTFNFIGDTTYTTREGISYRIDNKEHNIQRVGKSWVVDGKASSLEEMVTMGIAKKI